MIKKVLPYPTKETPYVVADYPYGFRLRCQMRYWIEYKKGFGFRLVTQTSNPKQPGEVWNKPKTGNYWPVAYALYLDENDHVKGAGLSYYSSLEESEEFGRTYGHGLSEEGIVLLGSWTLAKKNYEAKKAAREQQETKQNG